MVYNPYMASEVRGVELSQHSNPNNPGRSESALEYKRRFVERKPEAFYKKS